MRLHVVRPANLVLLRTFRPQSIAVTGLKERMANVESMHNEMALLKAALVDIRRLRDRAASIILAERASRRMMPHAEVITNAWQRMGVDRD